MLFQRGTLWQSIIERTDHALTVGAQQPISTDHTFIEQSGIRFFVRILSSLARKDSEKEKTGKTINPFLPYDPDLFVAHVSESHVAILNKFNVVDHHLLIVTRDFEDQDRLLTRRDFEALWTCMAEYDGLGFYNGGEEAGASQQHKHLQIVPLPLAPEGLSIPLEPVLEDAMRSNGPVASRHLPFLHTVARLHNDMTASPSATAEETFNIYMEMLNAMDIQPVSKDNALWQSRPYCLVIKRNWMFLVPRSRELFHGISINSLGFAGALLVRTRKQMELLTLYGPMTALREVAFPPL